MDGPKRKSLRDLGWANGWKTNPPELEEAKRNGWKVERECTGRCEHTYRCEEGGWYYRVDSSD